MNDIVYIGAAIGTLVLLTIATVIMVPRFKQRARVDPTETRKQAQHDALVEVANSKSIPLTGRESTADVQFLVAQHNRQQILDGLKSEKLPTV